MSGLHIPCNLCDWYNRPQMNENTRSHLKSKKIYVFIFSPPRQSRDDRMLYPLVGIHAWIKFSFRATGHIFPKKFRNDTFGGIIEEWIWTDGFNLDINYGDIFLLQETLICCFEHNLLFEKKGLGTSSWNLDGLSYTIRIVDENFIYVTIKL